MGVNMIFYICTYSKWWSNLEMICSVCLIVKCCGRGWVFEWRLYFSSRCPYAQRVWAAVKYKVIIDLVSVEILLCIFFHSWKPCNSKTLIFQLISFWGDIATIDMDSRFQGFKCLFYHSKGYYVHNTSLSCKTDFPSKSWHFHFICYEWVQGLDEIECLEISLSDKPTWYKEKVYPAGKVRIASQLSHQIYDYSVTSSCLYSFRVFLIYWEFLGSSSGAQW